jgi:small subunit ribosomal protein S20
MAHSLHRKKRLRQNEAHRARNRWRKRRFRTAIKDFDETVLHGSVTDAEQKLRSLYKLLDQVASTPALHKNTASRYKSRLAARLNRKKAEGGSDQPAEAAPAGA